MKKITIFSILFILTGCLNDSCDTVGPDIPTVTTTTVAPVDDPSTYPGVTIFGKELLVGYAPVQAFTAFALPLRSKEYAYNLCTVAKGYGLNTARIFVETRNWIHSRSAYLQQVVFDYDPDSLEQVVHGLGQAGCAVELVLIATAKEETRQAGLDLIEKGIEQFRTWPNTFYSMCNEYNHHSSVYTTKDAKRFLDFANHLCPQCLVGIDEAIEKPRQFHNACGVNNRKCDFLAWHPSRNDPKTDTVEFFTKIVNRGNLPAFFDEIVCMASDANLRDYPELKGPKAGVIALLGLGTEEQRHRYSSKVYYNVLYSGGHPCWHSIDLMLCIDPPESFHFPERGL